MFDNLTRRISGIFSNLRRKGRLSEDDVKEVLREIRVALLEADVNFQVAKDFCKVVAERAVGEEVYGSLSADQTIVRIVRDTLVEFLRSDDAGFKWSPSPPTVVVLCGLQGSGKTTTAAKLAVWLQKQGKKPMLAACDIQRPAAVHQLEVLGESIGVPVFSLQDGTSPPLIARRALERAKFLMQDVLIVDTAGRLQIDAPLMDELQAIVREVRPSETFLVVDSTTGQEAVNVAQAFSERVQLTGSIFTKLDGDTRGGAVVSVKAATGVPVRFVGLGEKTDALEAFSAQRMAERIIGMGDVLGIIERAEEAIDKGEALALEAKLKGGGAIDFNDLLAQFRTIRKMGPIQNVLKMIPGLSAQVSEEDLNKVDERQIDRMQAVILSMTPIERANPDIINGSRRKRIAAGSGTSVEDVNMLLRQLTEMRRSLKQFKKLEKRFKKRGRR
ncbi:MAG: signal recognition particle protein [Fimbriimonadaceae bacterium]|uniref:Signal recognition particle protein n=1 Tax=Candidatus Nitrosymbiomonas proteolyticus TaxID=2608984 RepID=A0A809RCV2_9BACT|nr:signal recognition particle protein [Fimbriimonadaceae bacterium]NUM38065.1 signal recognition particle protein [Armatimonadota bacterium]BBO24478.1 signal recognition particle protein [Candidatus Nitrosymbiomonas proteolyticus]HQU18473.1 signal recognition particle protein [Fimbriimonadaceae bacterium]